MSTTLDGVIKYTDIRHVSVGGCADAEDRDYSTISIRETAIGGHSSHKLEDYHVDIVLRPKFKPYYLRGKYNPDCIVYVSTQAQADRGDKPGRAWELVEVKAK